MSEKEPIDNLDNNKKALINALRLNLGVISQACKAANVSRQTFYNWREKDSDFRDAVEEIEEESKDFVESQLFKQIRGGNMTGIIFFLKTRAKDRGYTEKVIHENYNTDLTDEELEQRIRELEKKTKDE